MENIEKVFEIVKRIHFVPESEKRWADLDIPLPIGYSQTISQPSTVRQMLEWLDVIPGDRVLDVGSGSGWTSALLSFLVGDGGSVYAVERIPGLLEFGKANCKKMGIQNIQFFIADHRYGLTQYSPYDKILVSASAREIPNELITQLKPGGKMVIPVNHDILEVEKTKRGKCMVTAHEGYMFVPLI